MGGGVQVCALHVDGHPEAASGRRTYGTPTLLACLTASKPFWEGTSRAQRHCSGTAEVVRPSHVVVVGVQVCDPTCTHRADAVVALTDSPRARGMLRGSIEQQAVHSSSVREAEVRNAPPYQTYNQLPFFQRTSERKSPQHAETRPRLQQGRFMRRPPRTPCARCALPGGACLAATLRKWDNWTRRPAVARGCSTLRRSARRRNGS